MSAYLEKHRFLRGLSLLIRRYFDHHVARDSAALTYYLLFALFPLLVFLNNLVGLLDFDVDEVFRMLSRIMPQDVADLIRQYLTHLSQTSSRKLMFFALVFSVYFPYRAAAALFFSVRKAYGEGPPRQVIRYHLRVVLFTILFIITLLVTIVVVAMGRRALEFIASYIYLDERAIKLWTQLRFLCVAVMLFSVITLLYTLALDRPRSKREIMPGVLVALALWTGLSLVFSMYVEHAGRYSIIYGSIGGIIVLLLWLNLSSTSLILGAEFNCARLETLPHPKEKGEKQI